MHDESITRADATAFAPTDFDLAGFDPELAAALRAEERRQEDQSAAPFIELLIELRAELRKAKQYAIADMVRGRLADLGIVLEDSAQGTRWKAK